MHAQLRAGEQLEQRQHQKCQPRAHHRPAGSRLRLNAFLLLRDGNERKINAAEGQHVPKLHDRQLRRLSVDQHAPGGACVHDRPAAVVIDLKIAPFYALCAAGVGSGEGGEIFFGGVTLICCVVEPVVRGNFICAVVQIENILRRAVRLCCLLGAACKQQAERCQQNNGQKLQVLFHVQFLSQKKMLEMICIHYKSAQKRRRLTGS